LEKVQFTATAKDWNVLSGNLLQFAVEAIPVEIVDFPINSMVDLSIAR
jgi:hypothetical protein